MTNKAIKWIPQEDTMLGELRAAQNDKSQINWEKIAIVLNNTFHGKKSAKQCRERYVNYIKFHQKGVQCIELTSQELNIFFELFLEHGSAWSLISKKINKSQNNLKNKFHNFVRKACNLLYEHEYKFSNNKRRSICPALLIPMIDLTSQVKRLIGQKNLTLNHESELFKFRRNFVHFSFFNATSTEEQALSLIHQIKNLNRKLRCFGAFKVKNRKNWKITMKTLKSIIQFDNVIFEDIDDQGIPVNAFVKVQENMEKPQQEKNQGINQTVPQVMPIFMPNPYQIKQEQNQNGYYVFPTPCPWPYGYMPGPFTYEYDPNFLPTMTKVQQLGQNIKFIDKN